jgi:hypothetical protein
MRSRLRKLSLSAVCKKTTHALKKPIAIFMICRSSAGLHATAPPLVQVEAVEPPFGRLKPAPPVAAPIRRDYYCK